METGDKLQRGSYNGIEFYTKSNSVSKGQKAIKYEYPKSSRTEVEFMGLSQPVYNISCLLYGNDLFKLKKDFEEELDNGEYGSLVHPRDGQLTVAVMPGYTRDESEAEIGIIRYNISFQVVTNTSSPDKAKSYKGKIAQAQSRFLDSGKAFMKKNYKTTFVESLEKSANQLTAITDSISATSSELTGLPEDKSIMVSLIDDVKSNLFDNISNAGTYYDSVSSMYNSLASLGTDRDSFNTFVSYFDSGDLIPTSDLTIEKQEAQTNTETVNVVMQSQALLYAYSATQDMDFVLYKDLAAVQQQLDAQYNKIYTSLSGDMQIELDDLRNLYNESYLELDVYDLIEIEGNGQSLTSLVYQYYGDLEFYEIIKELNGIRNPAFVEGTIEVLNNANA